jgi:hypothetical protein
VSYASQTPLKYKVEVHAQGHIELQVPFAAGQKIVVLVLPDDRDDFRDLMSASMSSFAFWDDAIENKILIRCSLICDRKLFCLAKLLDFSHLSQNRSLFLYPKGIRWRVGNGLEK